MAKILPWEEMIRACSKSLSRDKGQYGIDGRLVVEGNCSLGAREYGLSLMNDNGSSAYFDKV